MDSKTKDILENYDKRTEKIFRDSNRIPNFTKDDYIIVDGKKRLNPNWEAAREERFKKNTYFRCPECNQGSVFIGVKQEEHTHGIRRQLREFFTTPEKERFSTEKGEGVTGVVFFFFPRKVNNSVRKFSALSFEYFKSLSTPLLWQDDLRQQVSEALHLSNLPDVLSYGGSLTIVEETLKHFCPDTHKYDTIEDYGLCMSDYTFYCLPCIIDGNFHRHTAEELIHKYHNPIDNNCDYESICNVCGAPVTSVIIPRKIPDTDTIEMASKIMCSNEDCNFDYTTKVTK